MADSKDNVMLTDLMICSHLTSKPSELRLASTHTNDTVKNLRMIWELSQMVCPHQDFKLIDNRCEQFKSRAEAARLYLEGSSEKIPISKDPSSKVTYGDIGDIVGGVLSSKYINTPKTPARPYFLESKVVIFWDILNCPIPEDFDDSEREAIPTKIRSALVKGKYIGEIEIYVVGDHGLPTPIVNSWSRAEVNFIPSPASVNGKETADKTMVLSASGWLYHHLRENGREPCTLLAITEDTAFRFVITLANSLGFRTLLARDRKGHRLLGPFKQMQRVNLLRGSWITFR